MLRAGAAKKFYRVWQASKNKVVTYQTYCAGTDSPAWVLSEVAHQATDVVGQGRRFVQVNACESEGFKRHFIMANATHQLEPITIDHDLFQMCQPLALAGPENAPVWVQPPQDCTITISCFSCKDFSNLHMHRKGKTKKQNIISDSGGSSGETFCGTLEGAYHSNSKLIISENVWNLLEDEGEARTDELGNITLASMDVIRARAAEFHCEVVAVKVNTCWYRLPQSRRRVYLVFANSRFFGISPAETSVLLAHVRDIFVSLGDKAGKHLSATFSLTTRPR